METRCRRGLIVAVVVSLTLGGAGAAASDAVARDRVTLEDGWQEQSAETYFGAISIDVESGPRGANPRGDVAFLVWGLQLRAGEATCLAVRRNRATINFIDAGSGQEPSVVTVQVHDGEVDTFDAALGRRGPNNCSRMKPTPDRGPLVEGELRIHDARAKRGPVPRGV